MDWLLLILKGVWALITLVIGAAMGLVTAIFGDGLLAVLVGLFLGVFVLGMIWQIAKMLLSLALLHTLLGAWSVAYDAIARGRSSGSQHERYTREHGPQPRSDAYDDARAQYQEAARERARHEAQEAAASPLEIEMCASAEWQLLINESAAEHVRKSAYRELARRYHPDRHPGKDEQTTLCMQRINSVWKPSRQTSTS